MPIEVFYIFGLLALICIAFLVFKRPIYECMFYGFILMIIFTGDYANIFNHIFVTSKDTLFYSIVCFLVLAKILDETHVIDAVVGIICAIFGRLRGGAGYTAIIGSTFMGALSGSGAGNVATTGVFTIPAMKKSGFPSFLAANVEASASTMGNMIPPAGVIVAALACYNTFSGKEMSQSTFWLACWGVAVWFILQRIVTLWVFCKIYKVEPMNKEDIPSLKETLKKGWKGLFLPVVILLPFILDYFLKSTFFTLRLGTGASNFSSSLLLFTPGVAAIYALCIAKNKSNVKELINHLKKSILGIVPVAATIFFAYCISNVFTSTEVGKNISMYIQELNLSRIVLAIIVPLICAILGMVLPGSAQTKIFGGTIISAFAVSGGNPLLVAVMLPVITGAMEGITPPLALCTYTAMGIAEAPMKETIINSMIWVGLHYVISVLCLLGILPVFGL